MFVLNFNILIVIINGIINEINYFTLVTGIFIRVATIGSLIVGKKDKEVKKGKNKKGEF